MDKTTTMVIMLLIFSLYGCRANEDTQEANLPKAFNIEMSGKYQVNRCNVTANTAKIKIEYLEDGVVESTINEQSDTEKSVTFNRDLSGSIVGIRLSLPDYNPNNLDKGLGDGFGNLNVKIINNQSKKVVIDTTVDAWLVHCTDIAYEVEIHFNTTSEELTTQQKWH